MANIELDGVNKKIKVDSGDLTLDVPGDIVLDADGGDVVVADGGTNILKVTNSSSDVVLQPQVDAKDIIFKQFDGTTVATVEDNGTFNIPTDKLAINGTAVTSTAAELNILDGVTATASELNLLDGGTSVGSSITLADGDGFVVNDGGTMKTIPATDVATYTGGGGIVPITTVAFSSGTELVINNCFSSTYLNYMMIISLLVPQSDASLNYRFNVGGTADSTSNYRYTLEGYQNSGSGTSNYSNGSTDEGRLFYDIDADSEAGASGVFYIHNPYGGYQRKQIHGNTILQKGSASNTTQYQVATDYHNSTTKNFTGINLFSSGATNWRAGSTSGGYGRVSIFGIVNS